MQKLHQAWDLPLICSIIPPKPSGIRQVITVAGDRINLVATRDEIGPFEVAYADFTELLYVDGCRKGYLIPSSTTPARWLWGGRWERAQ